jgi:acyl CoA:acetate/3-ketoacid CoA transferase
MCQAAKNSGGKVIVQVEKIVQGGSLDPKLVAIPGIYVDAVVVGTEEDNMQCLGMPYDGALPANIVFRSMRFRPSRLTRKRFWPAVRRWSFRRMPS